MSKPVPNLNLSFLDWKEIGDPEDSDPKGRLLAQLHIDGVPFHVEAREVIEDPDNGWQTFTHYPEDFEVFVSLVDSGRFQTVEIDGRAYFIFILPYGA